jgi:hypothetical protein
MYVYEKHKENYPFYSAKENKLLWSRNKKVISLKELCKTLGFKNIEIDGKIAYEMPRITQGMFVKLSGVKNDCVVIGGSFMDMETKDLYEGYSAITHIMIPQIYPHNKKARFEYTWIKPEKYTQKEVEDILGYEVEIVE